MVHFGFLFLFLLLSFLFQLHLYFFGGSLWVHISYFSDLLFASLEGLIDLVVSDIFLLKAAKRKFILDDLSSLNIRVFRGIVQDLSLELVIVLVVEDINNFILFPGVFVSKGWHFIFGPCFQHCYIFIYLITEC